MNRKGIILIARAMGEEKQSAQADHGREHKTLHEPISIFIRAIGKSSRLLGRRSKAASCPSFPGQRVGP